MLRTGQTIALKWKLEHDQALARYISEGKSASQIAAALNSEFETTYSRNSVIGRAHRIGTFTPGEPVKSDKPRKRSPRPRLVVSNPVPPPRAVTEAACGELQPLGIRIEELDSLHCRWPYGDGVPYTFCGHLPMIGSRYCLAHFQLSVSPWQPK
jgi:GcrA cell cycle regulator